MGMRVFFGGEFEHGHERAALIELMGEAVARWGEERAPYALFVDFWVDTAKIDLMAITEHALVIIDLKEVGVPGGHLTGSLNGSWTFHAPDGGGHVVNPGRENPFKQVAGYRQAMITWLQSSSAKVFGNQKSRMVDPQLIDGWIVVSPSLDEARTAGALSFIPERERRWFSVVALDRLCDQLFTKVHPSLRITEPEIERMANLHGLKERKNYAGFVWPGTLTHPKPPLFREPPRYRGSVGRRAELDDMTRAVNGKASVLVLIGVPGVGKTHLASGLAALLAAAGRPVKWVDCGPTRSCEVSLETLLLALAHEMPPTVDRQIVADHDQPLSERIDKALGWCDAARLVLVFDDYNELRADHGLDHFIQRLDQCCQASQLIISSSRRPHVLADPLHPLGGAQAAAVGGLSQEDSVEYLRNRSRQSLLHLDLRNANPQIIWERTGGIPASLERLARAVGQPGARQGSAGGGRGSLGRDGPPAV